MNAILVPMDGSALAERAIPFAARIATSAGRSLVLLRAVDGRGLLNEPAVAALKARLLEGLDLRAAKLRKQGLRVETRVIGGEPDQVILEAAGADNVGLIVMSTHGWGGLRRWILGSTADVIVRESPVPVLLVPPSMPSTWPMDRPVKILIPLDGSPLAEEAIGPAHDLAQALNGTLVLTRVVACPRYNAYIEGEIYVPEEGYTLIPEPEDVARLAEARIYLDDLAAPLRTDRQPVEASATFGVPRVSVARIAQETGADLIVMATHGHSGLTRALLGSVATSTLQRANVPLLLVRPSPAQLAAQPSTSMSAPITEEVVPSDEALRATVAPISLSFDELETLIASIGERFHDQPVDPRYAEPTQALLARLRAARASVRTPAPVS